MTPAELTTVTTEAHIHFRPRIWLAGRRLMSISAASLRIPSTTATEMISLRVRSSRSLHCLAAMTASQVHGRVRDDLHPTSVPSTAAPVSAPPGARNPLVARGQGLTGEDFPQLGRDAV